VDPFGDVLPCNGMPEKQSIGKLSEDTFEDIWLSEKAGEIRSHVARCDRGCWMVGSAVPAMRKHLLKALTWTLGNKTRLYLGKDIVV